MTPLRTERLDLVPATPDVLRAALDGRLGEALDARVPDAWPPEGLDDDVLRVFLEQVVRDARDAPWWLWYCVRREPERALVGTCGFKGAPDAARAQVEIGYSTARGHDRRGYATEATRALARWALANGARRVVADVMPENLASRRVLAKCGFAPAGAGAERGSLRYALEAR